jgi:hypothetical protein
MSTTTHHLSITAIRVDALFASALQRSDEATTQRIHDAIAGAVRQYGGRGCAGRVAQEFGDHPELAVARMRWVRRLVDEAFGPAHSVARQVRLFDHRPVAHAVRAA